MIGGAGDDTLIGGGGNDSFVFKGLFGDDVIQDLNVLEGDTIDLSKIIGAEVSVQQVGNDLKLNVSSDSNVSNGTITLSGMNMEDWNTFDQESILMFNTAI